MDSDTLGTTAGEYIVVPLRSTSATPYGFGSQQGFVANVIGSKDDPKPPVSGKVYQSWLQVMRVVLRREPTCQVTKDYIYTDSSTISKADIQDLIDAIKARQWERQNPRDLNSLDGGHVVLGSDNQEVAAGEPVYMLAIPHWLNVLSYPSKEEDWGTKFAMKTIPNAVGVKLSGYLRRG